MNLFRCFPYLWSLDLEYSHLNSHRTTYWIRRLSSTLEDGSSPVKWLQTTAGLLEKTVTRIGPLLSKAADPAHYYFRPASEEPLGKRAGCLCFPNVTADFCPYECLNMRLFFPQMHFTFISLLQVQTAVHAREQVTCLLIDLGRSSRRLTKDWYDCCNKKLGYCSSPIAGILKNLSMTYGLYCWWIREEQVMSSTWTRAKHLTVSCATSLPLTWRDMDLTGGPLGG